MKCAINLIRFQRFDEGTIFLVLGKPKLITLHDAICNLTPRELRLHCDPCFDQNLNSSLIAECDSCNHIISEIFS